MRYASGMAARAPQVVSYPEYLVAEERAEVRHEYHDGAVVAMSGGTPEHSLLAANVVRMLGNALEGKPCRAFESNLRLHLPVVRRGLYPDASVICGRLEHAPADKDAAVNPTVIVEVLSPSSEGYDRGEKHDLYRTLASFQEYVLISSERVRVEVMRRDADGSWHHEYFGSGDAAPLKSIDVTLSVDALYDGWAELRAAAAD